MKIADIDIRVCRSSTPGLTVSEMRYSTVSTLEFLVISMRTDGGVRADTFGFVGTSGQGAGHLAADALRPFFLGRDPLFREKHWHDFQMANRWWHHLPIYSYGPFDICCWLLAATAAGQPLYQYLGACRDRVPIYGSSLILPSAEAYAEQAVTVKRAGWAAYKVHPPGVEAVDRVIHRMVREAVGEGFTLMSDPVAAYNHEQALRVGRDLERLDYHWFEEPLFDTDLFGLKELSRALDIAVCGAEVIPGSHYVAATYLAERAVDIIRTDVSWKGGITPVLKTAHLAESFGVQCEIHTAVLHPLELVNLHCCAAINNCEFFEVLLPTERFDFGLKAPIRIEDGCAVLPERPGLGIDLDWDFIDNCTVARL